MYACKCACVRASLPTCHVSHALLMRERVHLDCFFFVICWSCIEMSLSLFPKNKKRILNGYSTLEMYYLNKDLTRFLSIKL